MIGGWDDENRLLAINDNGYVSSYLYNANGDRTVKLSGNNEAVYVNTVPSANETQTDRFTIYPSPYMVFTNGGRYTKHIYIGSERIVSKVAIDNGYNPATTPTAAYGNNTYVTRLNNKSVALSDLIIELKIGLINRIFYEKIYNTNHMYAYNILLLQKLYISQHIFI